jgi:hypothetical protein
VLYQPRFLQAVVAVAAVVVVVVAGWGIVGARLGSWSRSQGRGVAALSCSLEGSSLVRL